MGRLFPEENMDDFIIPGLEIRTSNIGKFNPATISC
jgi:hypothetical protein